MAVGSSGERPMWLLGVAGLMVVGGLAWWSGQTPKDLHGVSHEATEAQSPRVPGVGGTPEPDWFRDQREAAEASLSANPNDLDALNVLTQIYVGDPPMGMKYNRRALEIDATDPDARVLKAVLASEMALHEVAIEGIDGVLAEHPEHPRALYFLGMVTLASGDAEGAMPQLQAALDALGPDPGLQAALASADHAVNGPSDAVISGTVELALEGVGAAVFVSVRDPAGGSPLAAIQLPNGPYPLTFAVTEGDVISMGGEPRAFPDIVDVSARLDQDGNARTKVEGQPAAELTGIAVGSRDLAITLQ